MNNHAVAKIIYCTALIHCHVRTMLYECFGSLKQKKNQQDIGNTLLKKNLAI
jgi:hypothetical protein